MRPADRARALAALRRGRRFLEASQGADGYWRDYVLAPGASSDWVTAFVGFALAGAGSSRAPGGALDRAARAVRGACRPTGWGYNQAVATDADTTAWVVRWFARMGVALPMDPVSCLQAYLLPSGGATTFACSPRHGRWALAHADVTAVVGLALLESGAPVSVVEGVAGWALAERRDDGLWRSFWWTFDDYVNAWMLELLAATGGVPAEVRASARRAAEDPARDSLTAMERANRSRLALHAGGSPQPWIDGLLDLQRTDGSWPPSRVLKLPDQKVACGVDPVFADGNGFLSTAMSLIALADVLQRARTIEEQGIGRGDQA